MCRIEVMGMTAQVCLFQTKISRILITGNTRLLKSECQQNYWYCILSMFNLVCFFIFIKWKKNLFFIETTVIVVNIRNPCLGLLIHVHVFNSPVRCVCIKIIFTVSCYLSCLERDFRWVFLTRFLMQQGVATVTG